MSIDHLSNTLYLIASILFIYDPAARARAARCISTSTLT
jgi:hypothetical protein